MSNEGDLIKEVESTEKTSMIQNRAKERDFLSKKKNKGNKEEEKETKEDTHDFIKDVKDAARYGDIGHGIMIDKKV